MDSNTKQLMAVFSLMLGLSWGIPYVVSATEERNAGWLMLSVIFLLIALGLYFWITREQKAAEESAQDALDAAEENLKRLEAQAAQAVPEDDPVPVEDRDLPLAQTPTDENMPGASTAADIEAALDDADDEPVTEAVEVAEPDEEAPPAEVVEVAVEVEEDTADDDSAADEPDEPVASDEPDDLTRIEGIGPKYSDILIEAGITTFEQIAAMSEDDIVTLVKANGGRRSASMATWPEQAKLAAANDWDGLDQLQEELNGGRR